MNLQDSVIRGESIIIDDCSTFNSIGSDVVLDGCTVRCKVPAKNLSIRGELVRTLVIAESNLTGFSWLEARLNDCAFQGGFTENEFGTLGGSTGSCDSCDFGNADLEDCVFYGETWASHTFPRWPGFTIVNPHANLAKMRSRPKHDRLEDVVNSIEFLDERAIAITYNSNSLARRIGLGVEQIQTFFSQFTFVQ